MNTFTQLVDAATDAAGRGGTVALAHHCGVSPSTVRKWKTEDSVPSWHLEGLQEFLAAHGLEVTHEQLIRLAAARRPVKRHPLEGAQ